jgi:hypothetical protein
MVCSECGVSAGITGMKPDAVKERTADTRQLKAQESHIQAKAIRYHCKEPLNTVPTSTFRSYFTLPGTRSSQQSWSYMTVQAPRSNKDKNRYSFVPVPASPGQTSTKTA